MLKKSCATDGEDGLDKCHYLKIIHFKLLFRICLTLFVTWLKLDELSSFLFFSTPKLVVVGLLLLFLKTIFLKMHKDVYSSFEVELMRINIGVIYNVHWFTFDKDFSHLARTIQQLSEVLSNIVSCCDRLLIITV